MEFWKVSWAGGSSVAELSSTAGVLLRRDGSAARSRSSAPRVAQVGAAVSGSARSAALYLGQCRPEDQHESFECLAKGQPGGQLLLVSARSCRLRRRRAEG